MKLVEFIDEAEIRTPASTQIRTTLRKNGYKLLGSGADATVWAKNAGEVVKIIMPDDHQGAGVAGDTFMKFYEFCKENKTIQNLPKFSGKEIDVFKADGKEYVMVIMERLNPIPENSFQEAMVWILSDLATKRITWKDAKRLINDDKTWQYFESTLTSKAIKKIFNNLDKTQLLEYEILFKLMTLLYHKGKINKLGWDLHTENAMMRGNTIVITDPWFNGAV